SIGSSAFLPLITVSGGTLHLSNFNVVHKCIEEPTDTIVVNNGGKCNITNVQFQGENSTFCLLQHSEVSIGKCRLIGGSTAISVSNSSTLKLTDTVISAFTHVGVNIISGASANIQKSTVSCCGQHAILSHNGAQRVELIHSKIISNSNCQEGHVPAVQLSAGKQNLIRHCEILKNGGPGIRITHGSECAIEDSIFKQNPIAINVIGRSRCSIIRCRMVEVSVGLDILHNQNGQVFMKDNTIKPSIAEVMMLSSDSIPTMVGRLHKVKLRDDVSSKHIRTPRLETLQKVVAPKKFVR
ncbi:uncharacterized protein LOC102803561, partial [Saccoglossus kowalevskii]|uniref:Uncharacterized protein LOC102803561 n=1 Tax=Saccoglossus kowalevskii TaxID=10224 RepID=A0ABM0M0C6_SACKO